jgi:hypothetical protein
MSSGQFKGEDHPAYQLHHEPMKSGCRNQGRILLSSSCSLFLQTFSPFRHGFCITLIDLQTGCLTTPHSLSFCSGGCSVCHVAWQASDGQGTCQKPQNDEMQCHWQWGTEARSEQGVGSQFQPPQHIATMSGHKQNLHSLNFNP